MKKIVILIVGLLFVLSTQSAEARNAVKQFEAAVKKDPSTMNQLLMYPPDIRKAMLEVSLYPNTVEQIGSEQAETSRAFRNYISQFPQKTQEKIYQLVRYPNLLRQLVQDGKLSKGKIKKLTKDYPKDIQKTALELGRDNYKQLSQIQNLYDRAERNFQNTIQSLPLPTQTAFRKLLEVPEVLSLLTQDKNLTTLMGKAYREDAPTVVSQLNSWSEKAKQENAEDLAQWEEEIRNYPQAMEEMKESGKVYAKEHGYTLEEVNQETAGNVTVVLGINPFPFWFGYPYWWGYPYWRPYPYWWDLGWYYGYGGGLYFWGYPSYRYCRWYYGGYRNFYRYPHLSNYYYQRYNRYYNRYYPYRSHSYYGSRRSSNFYNGMSSWHKRHPDLRRSYWNKNDGRGAARFRDHGHFEESYNRYKQNNPQSKVTRSQYFQKNRSKYPNLGPRYGQAVRSRTKTTPPTKSGSGTIRKSGPTTGTVQRQRTPQISPSSSPGTIQRSTYRPSSTPRYRSTTPSSYRPSGGSSRGSGSFRSGGSRGSFGGSRGGFGGGRSFGGGGRRR